MENTYAERDLDKFEKMQKYQLPHHFKRIGFGIFIVSFIAMFVIAFAYNQDELKTLSKYGILLGLLIISISKEPIEDELIIKLRMQSYTMAFIIGVLYALLMPFVDFFFDTISQAENPEITGMGDFVILWMLLFVQLFFFHIFKRSINEE